MTRRLFSSLPAAVAGVLSPVSQTPPVTIEINVRCSSEAQAADLSAQLATRLRELLPSAECTGESTRTLTAHGVDSLTREFESQQWFTAPGPFRADR